MKREHIPEVEEIIQTNIVKNHALLKYILRTIPAYMMSIALIIAVYRLDNISLINIYTIIFGILATLNTVLSPVFALATLRRIFKTMYWSGIDLKKLQTEYTQHLTMIIDEVFALTLLVTIAISFSITTLALSGLLPQALNIMPHIVHNTTNITIKP